ncbi:galactose-1-phosphate uridylyltransferase [Gemmata sp.]|uniref:galactose-1-phosphate uridylyltransferase n=1 Tax=Gemmata sp. TaxID=1914242 RepID=UPI003F7046BE
MSPEPEFRRDPVCGRWAVVAPERSHRPITLEGVEPRHRRNGERRPCPFCPGQEHDTPDEVLAYRDPGSPPDGPGWHLRVVPNKFPAVRPDVGGAFCAVGGMVFLTTPGFGRAEVVIECAEHLADPTALSPQQLTDVFRAYRARLVALADDSRLAYAAVFKNVGAEAGASLGHTHSQIIALPIVPDAIEAELLGAEAFHARTGRCVFCDLAARELAAGERVVARSENFLAVTAFAPRYAYEFWVLPLAHSARYEAITDALASELAGLIRRVLVALDGVRAEPAYNWFLHTAPLRSPELPHYHWHIEVLPRTARPAGLEWGYGCFITTVSPEHAAAELRGVLPPDQRPVG